MAGKKGRKIALFFFCGPARTGWTQGVLLWYTEKNLRILIVTAKTGTDAFFQ
jgi:hypothetical protein